LNQETDDMTTQSQRSKITLTADQRDALYEAVYIHLGGIDAVVYAAERGDFEEADQLGWAFADDLLLILSDLGWGEHGSSAELKSPPDLLRRVLERVRKVAEAEDRDEEVERAELAEQQRRNKLIRETCSRVLRALDRS
jgi:hypothetical protein